MKITELVENTNQLDELNLKGLGTGLGKAVGGVAGGIAQGAKNVWSGMKQGYQAGQNALAPDGAPAQQQGQQAASAPTQQAQQPTAQQQAQQAPAQAAADMKAGEIVKGLQDVWGKATASQGSQTGSPAVQNQIRDMAKAAGMAGQTISENKKVKFRSNFLGMDI
jgi:hypothetical protein